MKSQLRARVVELEAMLASRNQELGALKSNLATAPELFRAALLATVEFSVPGPWVAQIRGVDLRADYGVYSQHILNDGPLRYLSATTPNRIEGGTYRIVVALVKADNGRAK